MQGCSSKTQLQTARRRQPRLGAPCRRRSWPSRPRATPRTSSRSRTATGTRRYVEPIPTSKHDCQLRRPWCWRASTCGSTATRRRRRRCARRWARASSASSSRTTSTSGASSGNSRRTTPCDWENRRGSRGAARTTRTTCPRRRGAARAGPRRRAPRRPRPRTRSPRSPGREKSAQFPTSISVGFRSFWLIFGRAIISRNRLEAWMFFFREDCAEHSR